MAARAPHLFQEHINSRASVLHAPLDTEKLREGTWTGEIKTEEGLGYSLEGAGPEPQLARVLTEQPP